MLYLVNGAEVNYQRKTETFPWSSLKDRRFSCDEVVIQYKVSGTLWTEDSLCVSVQKELQI